MSAKPHNPGLLAPAVALMQRLPMTVKMLAMAAVLLLPLAITGLQLSQRLWTERATAQLEIDGVHVVRAIAEVNRHLLDHQGQAPQAPIAQFQGFNDIFNLRKAQNDQQNSEHKSYG